MYFTEFITSYIAPRLPTTYPVYFYWNRYQPVVKPYVVYQTEDLELPEKLDSTYRTLLSEATHVYEYSEPNLRFWKSEFLPILPTSSLYNTVIKSDIGKTIDVLFYGMITPRRQSIIETLRAKYDIEHCTNLTHTEMLERISRSNWVLSIGSYNNLHNDLLRVTPALELGANILLEPTEEKWYDEYLITNFKNRIKFI